MYKIKALFLVFCFSFLLIFILTNSASFAGDLPPDREVATLKADLDENPDDISGWIRLADLQRIMGYSHQARESFKRAAEVLNNLPKEERREWAAEYYTARGWLEYDATNWKAAYEMGKRAVKYGGDYKAKTVRVLGMSNVPITGVEFGDALHFLSPYKDSGLSNRFRNFHWIMVVRNYHMRVDIEVFNYNQAGKLEPNYFWAELICRRDYGYIFEALNHWGLANQYYEWSVERSPVGRGNWATRYERHTPPQRNSDPTLRYWTNADGGYVTGSLMAYTDYACEQMLNAGKPEDRSRWVIHAGDGASRCLAVYINQPWPWLWRALAWQVQGDLKRAERDLAQAKAEFSEVDREAPLFAYAKGHELVMKRQYGPAQTWLEKAVKETPGIARCWSDLALALVMTHDWDGALAAFDTALELSPDLAVAFHNRGMLHLQAGRTDEALADLTRAAEIAPGDQQIVLDLQRARLVQK